MQKTIRTLAIIAAVLAGISLMLLVASIPFQQVLAREVFGTPQEAVSLLPLFPVLPFLSCFLRTGCIVLLIVCCGNKKGSIWLEILIMTVLAIVLPFINSAASTAYNVILGAFGHSRIIANSLISQIASFCCYPINLGQVLAYIACGMSIAFKAMHKQKTLEQ